MNEKIRQLAEQAGFYIDSAPIISNSNNPRLEKFAELVIEECIQTILKSTTLSDTKPKENYHVYTAAVVDALNGIKEHFGLEQ